MDVVLFHSILGLRPVEHEIASALAEDGHRVTLPDLFGGQSVEDYDSGFALRRQVGDAAVMARAEAALAAAPATAVLAGVSFGAFLIGEFWGNRPQMPAAVLIAGPAPWMEPRRPGLKVSAHVAQPDPFDDEAFFADWVAEAGGVDLALHRYAGGGHYFLDRSLKDFHAASAAQCMTNIRAFLASL
jgi:dienelactone hydrolase